MNDPCFIYPQWLRSKIDLFEQLRLDPRQEKVLSDWFRHNIFEVGSDYKIMKDYREKMNYQEKDLKKMIRQKGLSNLINSVLENGLYLEQETGDWMHESWRHTILVCATPLMIGKAKHKSL